MLSNFFKNGKRNAVVSIDIGSNLIKILELERKKDEVYVKNIGFMDTPPESVVAKEIIDREIIADAIKNLLEELKISKSFAVTSVGGKNLIIKSLLISPVESGEIETRIVEEAQKVLPFDIETVFWDYWILPPRPGSEEIPVYIVATRQETVYMIEDSLKYAGLTLGVLDATPLSIINTVKFNHHLDAEKNYLIIDIGYEGSSFILVSGGMYYDHQDGDFSVKKYVESLVRFMNVDQKTALGYLFDQDTSAELTASFETIINGLNQSLADEVQRYVSISGIEVAGIYLTGGGVNIKNIDEPLRNAFESAELVIVDPFKNVANVDEIEEKFGIGEREQRLFSLTFGAGLRGLEVPQVEPLINLSPYKKVERRPRIPPIVGNLIAPGVIFLASLIFIFIMNQEQRSTYQILMMQKQEIEEEKKLLGDKLNIMRELDRKKKELAQKVNIIREIAKDRAFYLTLLNDINKNIPPNTWLTAIKENREGGVTRFFIDGGAYTSIEVSNFMKRLSESKSVWEKVDLVYLRKNEDVTGSYVTFEIVVYPHPASGEAQSGTKH